MSADQPTWYVEVVEETGSTNADLLARGGAGAPDRTVLRTLHQTAGRGRLDRRWDAPPGANLLVSLLFREHLDEPHRLVRQVAVAACTAITATTGQVAQLKWPNDILLDGRKLAGILAEAAGDAGRVTHVVVGLGLNIGWAPDEAAKLGHGSVEPEVLLTALLEAFDELDRPGPDGRSRLEAAYRERLATLGQRVRVETAGGDIVGDAVDVLDDGRLVVRTASEERIVDTGDVVHLRPVAD